MTTQLALFPSDLKTLERTGRVELMRNYHLFTGFDRTLCVFMNHLHSDVVERRIDDRFGYLELGYRQGRLGRPGMAVGALGATRRLARHAREWNVDAVIAYDPHLLGLVGWALARRFRVPLAIRLVANYGLNYEMTGRIAFAPFRTRRIEEAVERWMYRHADVVLAACPNHQQYIERIAGPAVRIVPWVTAQSALFYDTSPVDARVRADLAPGAERVVIVNSRLVASKYPHDIHACADRLRDDTGLVFVVLGEGPLREDLERDARERWLRVIYAGLQSQERVRALFSVADAVIVLQGGGAITEAALCGAPIVTYDYEMNPFVVRPGYDEGLIVPFRDTTALAQAVRHVLDEPALARLMGRRVQFAARRRFSEAQSQRAERAIAERLLTPAKPASESFDAWQLDLKVGNADSAVAV